MTAKEYADYESAVAKFFFLEGISNLSSGHYQCPDCKVEFDDAGICPQCGADREILNEPHFSWRRCDCCNRPLGGDRGSSRVFGLHRLCLLCRVRPP